MFRSKPLTVALIALFLVLLGAESYPQAGNQSQSEFQKVFQAGKKLSEDGEHKEAITKLLQALTMAGNKDESAEACFYVSLAYYTLGERENCRTFLKRLFETQPAKEIDARMFPAGFVGLFNQARTEVEKRQAPKPEEKPKAEEKKAEPEKKVEETKKVEPGKKTGEEKPPAGIGKGKQEIPAKKKSILPWLIVGGVAAAGGVVALLLSKKDEPAGPQFGNIAITSQPSGAKVILDGNDTGQRSDCTLTNISAGARSLKLELENWGKWEGNVIVIGGQTTNVLATLVGYTYEFVTKWGSQGSGDGQFGELDGVAVDRNGNVYTADLVNSSVQQFTSAGGFLARWTKENRNWVLTRAVAVDNSFFIYVTDPGGHQVVKLNPGGNYVDRWGSYGSGDGQFNGPEGIAVDSAGNIYVADRGNDRIQKFSSTGAFIAKWGSRGSGTGQFQAPWGVAADGAGNIYVADADNNRVQKFNANGGFIVSWGSLGSANGQFNNPHGVIADASSEYVFVSDAGNNRIQKFTSSGTYVTKWGSWGSGDGQIWYPGHIAIDSSGNIFVADLGNYRVQKFRMTTQTMQAARITYTPIATAFNRPELIRPPQLFLMPARERAKEIPASAVRESPKKERIKEE